MAQRVVGLAALAALLLALIAWSAWLFAPQAPAGKTPMAAATDAPAAADRRPAKGGKDRAARPGEKIRKSILHRVAITVMPFDLGHPMDVAEANGAIFIVTRLGLLTYYDEGRRRFAPISTVEQNREALEASEIAQRERFTLAYFRTFGLLVEPSGANYRAYVGYHRFDDGCFYFEVATLTFALEADAARVVEDWHPLFTALPCMAPKPRGHVFAGHQAGGRIVPYDADHVLVAVGDHELDGNNGPATILDPDVPYGKVILLDKASGAWSVFAAGVRNPQGLLVAADGTIYETEHGPKGGDELNVITQGASYGWPANTYGIYYHDRPWPPRSARPPPQGRHDVGARPLFVWLPSIAVSNLTQVGPGQFPLWAGDLLISTLKAKSLYRLRIEDGRVIYEEQIRVGKRIRDVETLDSGHILATTDDEKLLVFSDAGAMFDEPRSSEEIAAGLPLRVRPRASLAAAPVDGRTIFETKCASCHRLDGTIEVAVPLDGLFERRVGSVAGFDYSPALARDQRRWNAPLLRAFLTRRDVALAANAMPPVHVEKAAMTALADYLAQPR